MPIKGKRIADEGIYLDGEYIEKPKEIFVFQGDLIDSLDNPSSQKILDVGCASGEFVHYLKHRFPNCQADGVDVSEALVKKAREYVPGSNFIVGSALDASIFLDKKYDVVNCCSVLSIFEDIEQPLRNFLSCVGDGGAVIINTIINEDPIDVVMNYRRSDSEGEWESGWNIFSKITVEKALHRIDPNLIWSWHPFEISFPLDKRDDTMRTWTMQTEHNPHQLINGACQLVNMQALRIVVR
jgi:SAM-dependent methyltransferase